MQKPKKTDSMLTFASACISNYMLILALVWLKALNTNWYFVSSSYILGDFYESGRFSSLWLMNLSFCKDRLIDARYEDCIDPHHMALSHVRHGQVDE